MSDITTGTAGFVVGGETYQTWYKVVGNLKSGIRPLVTLHGGPGVPHHYLSTQDVLYKINSIPVVFYDQLGCGASTHLPEKGKDFWTEELFMDELDNLLTHLGIADDFDLLGHSWGGMLGAAYASKRHPAGLKRLVLLDTPASMALWDASCAILLEGLPKDTQEILKKHQEAGTLEDPEYKAAVALFYQRHVCRTNPWPNDVLKSFAGLEEDPTVYNIMAGPNEFYIIGTLKTWSVIDSLHTITQPTLIVNSRYDEAQDICVTPLFENIPKAKWVQMGESSHMPFHEEPERYFKVVSQFLTANYSSTM
ncbi:hypothetical protein EW026_g6475 [Hermanssonia centrifuga]|uniref:AB hydrolase-1 domain-containing protein n=2 Tax=Hermanssonia centrifuga TaxID=98765 RepID=A0A2R6S636_9APHY|nr:hypothetical protein PHLCEN_2v5826 [Hermanssonia centrifuga]PSS37770.1 hypothetical protein PHLCEN_2v371 [Hermanssonia centrifuga]THG95118.1 hypothetical protein EW026_g6475 [Hermanssonia centrifuga]